MHVSGAVFIRVRGQRFNYLALITAYSEWKEYRRHVAWLGAPAAARILGLVAANFIRSMWRGSPGKASSGVRQPKQHSLDFGIV